MNQKKIVMQDETDALHIDTQMKQLAWQITQRPNVDLALFIPYVILFKALNDYKTNVIVGLCFK